MENHIVRGFQSWDELITIGGSQIMITGFELNIKLC